MHSRAAQPEPGLEGDLPLSHGMERGAGARALMLKRSSSAAQCNAGVLRTVRAGMRATAAWRAARRTALCARSMPTVVRLGGNTRTCSS